MDHVDICAIPFVNTLGHRRPEDVFAYLDQLDRYVEWQETLISTRVETEGPKRVGSRGVDRRRAPGGPRDIPFEVTEHDPAHKQRPPSWKATVALGTSASGCRWRMAHGAELGGS